MKRHDWAILGLIGLCGLGSFGLTHALVDARKVEPYPMGRMAPSAELDFHFHKWEPMEEAEVEPTGESQREVYWLPFGQKSERLISHGSYGLTLTRHPGKKPFLKVDPESGLELPIRRGLRKSGFYYSASPRLKPSG